MGVWEDESVDGPESLLYDRRKRRSVNNVSLVDIETFLLCRIWYMRFAIKE
jgi:hypothetical protein